MLTTVEVGLTAVTLPGTAFEVVRASRVTVAGCPTFIFTASASGKPVTTCRFDRSDRVMNVLDDEDEPELDEEPLPDDPAEPPAPLLPPPLLPLEPLPELPDELLEEEAADDPPPETVCPTLPFTAVMVPAKGAVRVVSARVLVSAVTVAWAWVTWA